MTGRRLPDNAEYESVQPGDYYRKEWAGTLHWCCMTPNGHSGNLSAHTVTEHEDGTITVHPSIKVSGGPNCQTELWHGYLERGIWREC